MKKIRIITNCICAAAILANIVLIALRWAQLPETIPVHFNASGTADGFGSRINLIVEPIIAVLIFGTIALVERAPSVWNFPVKITVQNRDKIYYITALLLGVVKVLTVLLILGAGVMLLYGVGTVWPIFVMMGLIFLCVIAGIGAIVAAK